MKAIGNKRKYIEFMPMYFEEDKALGYLHKGKPLRFKNEKVAKAFICAQPEKNKALAKEEKTITIYM